MNLIDFIVLKNKKKNTDHKDKLSPWIFQMGIFIVSFTVFIMGLGIAILQGFQGVIEKKIRDFGGDISLTQFQENDFFTSIGLDTVFFEKYALDTIFTKYPFALQPSILSQEAKAHFFVLKGIESTYLEQKLENYLSLKAKNWDSTQLILSEKIAKKLSLKIGDTVKVFLIREDKQQEKKLILSNIYKGFLPEIEEKIAFVPLYLLQKFQGWQHQNPPQIGGLSLFLKNNQNPSIISQNLQAQLQYRYKIQSWEENFPALLDWLHLLDKNVLLLIVILSILGLFHGGAIFLVLIFENQYRIKIFYRLGISKKIIFEIFLVQWRQILSKGLLMANLCLWTFLYLQKNFKLIPLDPETYFIDAVAVAYPFWEILFLQIGLGILSYFLLFLGVKKIIK